MYPAIVSRFCHLVPPGSPNPHVSIDPWFLISCSGVTGTISTPIRNSLMPSKVSIDTYPEVRSNEGHGIAWPSGSRNKSIQDAVLAYLGQGCLTLGETMLP